jgi:hypothetical protein
MLDVEGWVKVNEAGLEVIARMTGTPVDLVHVAAVLVRGGQSDEQILAECEALRPRLGSGVFEDGLHRALPMIRELSAKSAPPARSPG